MDFPQEPLVAARDGCLIEFWQMVSGTRENEAVCHSGLFLPANFWEVEHAPGWNLDTAAYETRHLITEAYAVGKSLLLTNHLAAYDLTQPEVIASLVRHVAEEVHNRRHAGFSLPLQYDGPSAQGLVLADTALRYRVFTRDGQVKPIVWEVDRLEPTKGLGSIERTQYLGIEWATGPYSAPRRSMAGGRIPLTPSFSQEEYVWSVKDATELLPKLEDLRARWRDPEWQP